MTSADNNEEQSTNNITGPHLAPCGEPVVGTECADIARLNDAFRKSFSGGRVVMSAGIAALPSLARAALLAAVRGFSRFDDDHDLNSERDFGVVTVAGYRCAWKIDACDRDLREHRPDLTDSAMMLRVLTVMLAEEY